MDYVGAIIGVLGTILGGVLSYAAFHRNSKKDSEEEGRAPQGARGLKFVYIDNYCKNPYKSCPARGAWVEIS